MATYLKPRRGKKATAEKILVGDAKLKKGEIFFEANDNGIGRGPGKIKFGDGNSDYGDLPYFMDPENASNSNVEFTEASDTDGTIKCDYDLKNKSTLNVLLTKIAGAIRNFHTRITNLETLTSDHTTKISTLESSAKNSLTIDTVLNRLYPVGSIVMTSVQYANSDAVKAVYGGTTWVQVETGRYLRTASGNTNDKAGGVGGNNSTEYTPKGSVGSHKLTKDEIPSHSHTFKYSKDLSHSHSFSEGGKALCVNTDSVDNGIAASDKNHGFMHAANNPNWWINTQKAVGSIEKETLKLNIDENTGSTGGSTAHTHGFTGEKGTITLEPKYYTVYVWRRTA